MYWRSPFPAVVTLLGVTRTDARSHTWGDEFSLITAAGILSIPSCASGLRYRFGGFTLVTARRFGIYDGELGAVLSGG